MANDIKILDHLNIDLDGDGIAERYEIGGMSELPIASSEVLGGVKIGENLTITEDGTLNAEASGTSVLSPGAVLYDTEEKIIGKWINGKPLYQKVGEIDTSIIDKIVYQSKDPYISTIPSMNQDETDEIKITAAGNSENNPPYRAFDKSYTGYEVCWYHNTLPTWIQVQFKTEPKKINKIKIGQEIATPAFFKTYIIQGSNDGTTYIDIATFVENYRSTGQIYEHTFENENNYSYYRIYFPDNGGTVAGVSVEEIDLFKIDYTDVITYYTKIADAENSFNIGMVENINLEQNIDFSNIYSTDERIVGSWINGKPIYQKVINLSETIVLQSYVWTNVFMIENMEKIIDIECIRGTELNDGRLRWNCLNNYICGAAEEDNFTINSCTIIIQYIKTTDEENSFTPDMIIDHENITDAEIAEAAAADKI